MPDFTNKVAFITGAARGQGRAAALAFAREGAASRVKLSGLVQKIKRVEADRDAWKFKYERLMNRAALFLDAMKRAPNRVMEFLKTVLREPPELQEPERRQPERTKNRSREMER